MTGIKTNKFVPIIKDNTNIKKKLEVYLSVSSIEHNWKDR